MNGGLTGRGPPADVKGVETEQELQVREHCGQRVELVRQPEIRETHVVERCCEDSELGGVVGGKGWSGGWWWVEEGGVVGGRG